MTASIHYKTAWPVKVMKILMKCAKHKRDIDISSYFLILLKSKNPNKQLGKKGIPVQFY